MAERPPIRVALLTYDDTPPEGGQGVYVRDLRDGVVARGVEMVTLSGRGDHAVPFRTLVHRAPLDFSLHINRNPDIVERLNADVVHLQGGPGGVLLTREVAPPVVVTAHHTYRQAYPRSSPRRVLSRWEARSYRQARMILAVSASTADAVRAMGIDAARVEVVPPGVRIPTLTDDASRVPQRLLFVGRMEPEKGVLDAVAVMAETIKTHPGASGRVIGRGRLAAEVAAACAVVDGVTFVGHVDDEQLAREYAEAEVVLVPSRYEGLGLVALEAMVAGAVVVGYDVVGLRDAALGVAILVPAQQRQALAAAVTSVLDDGAQRRDLAARGRAAVIKQHSWDRHLDRVIEAYHAAAI